MEKKIGMKWSRVVLAALMLLATSCQRDGGVIGHGHLPGVTGTFVLEDDDRNVALTSVQHSVFYEVGNDRKLIFKGAGGEQPRLSLIGHDTILLRYCRGSIYRTGSSFFDEPNGTNGLRIIRLQVITGPGLSAGGRPIC